MRKREMSLLQARAGNIPAQIGCCLLILFFNLYYSAELLAQPTTLSVELVAEGFDQPLAIGEIPGENAIFIAQQNGKIFKLFVGEQKSLLIDLNSKLSYKKAAKLYAVALHPKFNKNQRLFVAFLDTSLRERVMIMEYEVKAIEEPREPSPEELLATARGLAPDVERQAVEQNEHELLSISINRPEREGIQFAFAANDSLFISVGDAGNATAARSARSHLGTLLRVNVAGQPYTIPADNPYKDSSIGLDEVWAHGFREPTALAVGNDQVWLIDRGQEYWQEINLVRAGGNYGWDTYEGKQCLRTRFDCIGSFVEPVATIAYAENGGLVGAIVVKKGSLKDNLLLIDSASRNLQSLRITAESNAIRAVLLELGFSPISITHGANDEIYILSAEGKIYRLNY